MAKTSIGIVGLPNVGKSTLFNALTKKSVACENYPFCTIDPSVGVVAVPDDRLWKLSEFSKSEKTIPAVIEFVDIAGLVKGASEGEGLGNKFLSHIRETDAIGEMVRIFEDSNIIHVDGNINPLSDIEVINLELILADTQVVEKRLGSVEKDVKRNDKIAIKEKEALEKVKAILDAGKLANQTELNDEEKLLIKSLCLITMKPIMYILNKKAGGVNLDEISGDERWEKLMNFFEESGSKWTIVDAGIEHELQDFEGDEKEEMRKVLTSPSVIPAEAGIQSENSNLDQEYFSGEKFPDHDSTRQSPSLRSETLPSSPRIREDDNTHTDLDGINNLIRKGYELLDLITYFTTGTDESRAWTIGKGWTAPMAGTAIHNDFKDKFIRAEVVFWSDLLSAGSYGHAREKGLIRTEGKEYIVKDGDVIEFKI
jgi:GTP-binding protein YchF